MSAISLMAAPRRICPLRWAEMSSDAKRRILGLRPVMRRETAAAGAVAGASTADGEGPSAFEREVLLAVRALKRAGFAASAPRIVDEMGRTASSETKYRIRQALKALRRQGLVVLRFSPEGRLMDAEELVR